MSDFFHPQADNWRSDAWDVIRECDSLDWLILTKRPELIEERLPPDWREGYPNVWLGVTAGCRGSLKRIELLERIPAKIRFVSAEPLLESLDLRPYLRSVDWVITGCERARKGIRRVMDLNWVREIDSQCRNAAVPHFFKQYYQDETGVPKEDGRLDGEIRQEWPSAPAVV
jgi:protein gp37